MACCIVGGCRGWRPERGVPVRMLIRLKLLFGTLSSRTHASLHCSRWHGERPRSNSLCTDHQHHQNSRSFSVCHWPEGKNKSWPVTYSAPTPVAHKFCVECQFCSVWSIKRILSLCVAVRTVPNAAYALLCFMWFIIGVADCLSIAVQFWSSQCSCPIHRTAPPPPIKKLTLGLCELFRDERKNGSVVVLLWINSFPSFLKILTTRQVYFVAKFSENNFAERWCAVHSQDVRCSQAQTADLLLEKPWFPRTSGSCCSHWNVIWCVKFFYWGTFHHLAVGLLVCRLTSTYPMCQKP